MRVVNIPEERTGVLIGTDGETLEETQRLVDADIQVSDGEVTVDSDDPLEELRAYNIVKAIGRGFAPEKAFRLLEKNAILAILRISDYASTDNSKRRLKGRVIGNEGRSKTHIENVTDTEIAVYGKTVSIIGPAAQVEVAKKAVEMLLEGSSHGAAFRFMDENMAEMTKMEV